MTVSSLSDRPLPAAMPAPETARPSHRHALPLDPLATLQRCTGMGRVIIGMRAGGALLERIGPLRNIREENGRIVADDATATTTIDAAAVASIVIDRSETPHDTVLHYVDFLDADARSILKITALDGPEAFDRALGDSARRPLPYVPPLPRSQAAVDAADPAMPLLTAASASGVPVTLAVTRDGGTQSWRGVIVPPKPGHAYINVIQEGMHLHLAGGAVAGWVRQAVGDGVKGAEWTFAAIADDKLPTGLVIAGPAGAFAAFVERD